MKTVLHGCVAGKLQDLLNRGGVGIHQPIHKEIS